MKKYLFIALFLCSISPHVFAQFNFGIKLEYNKSNPNPNLSDWSTNNLDTELDNILTDDNVGFGLGIIGSYKVSEKWAITTQPTLAFTNSTLTYVFDNGDEEMANLESVNLQIPVQLEYHFQGIPLRPYLIGGGMYTYDFVDESDDRLLNLDRESTSIYAGVGIELRLNKFIIHPEFIVQKSVNNQLADTNSIYNEALSDLKIDYIALRFNFSGTY